MLRSTLAFSALAALLTIAPGPDFVLVLRTAIGYDRSRAIAASLGICSGLFVWALVSAAGITAVLAASTVAYNVLRVAGAAYLLWLGFDAIRRAGRLRDESPHGSAHARKGSGRDSSTTSSTRRSVSSTSPCCRPSSRVVSPCSR